MKFQIGQIVKINDKEEGTIIDINVFREEPYTIDILNYHLTFSKRELLKYNKELVYEIY